MQIIRALALVWLATQAQAQSPAPVEELKYAIIVTRHGVRSPTWTLDRLNEYSSAPWPDFGVAPGELTPHGRRLMRRMGAYYRQHLAATARWNIPGCEGLKRTWFHADNGQRTMETAKALAEGMFPVCRPEIHSVAEDESDPLFNPIEAGLTKLDVKLS